MADRTCQRCGKTFPAPCRLKAHHRRKTSCDPILDSDATDTGKCQCRYCGRGFTTPQGLSRHVKQNCKIANSEEGMDRLMEHTLQRQIAELKAQNAAQSAAQSAQIAE